MQVALGVIAVCTQTVYTYSPCHTYSTCTVQDLPRDVLVEFNDKMFKDMDTNKDGVVTQDEFVNHFNNLNATLRHGLLSDNNNAYRWLPP